MATYARIQDLAVAELADFDTGPVGRFHPSLVWQEVTDSQTRVGWRQTATGFEPPVVVAGVAASPGLAELQARLAQLAAQIAALAGASA